MVVFVRFVVVLNVLDIIESFSICDNWVKSVGRMYMFAICNFSDVKR